MINETMINETMMNEIMINETMINKTMVSINETMIRSGQDQETALGGFQSFRYSPKRGRMLTH